MLKRIEGLSRRSSIVLRTRNFAGNRVIVLRQGRDDGVFEQSSNEVSNAATLQHANSPAGHWEELHYSTDYRNAVTGFKIGELAPRHFSFNSHLWTCPACHGLGTPSSVRPGADHF